MKERILMQENTEAHDWVYTFFNSGIACWDRVRDESNTPLDEFIWNYVDRCIEIHKIKSVSED